MRSSATWVALAGLAALAGGCTGNPQAWIGLDGAEASLVCTYRGEETEIDNESGTTRVRPTYEKIVLVPSEKTGSIREISGDLNISTHKAQYTPDNIDFSAGISGEEYRYNINRRTLATTRSMQFIGRSRRIENFGKGECRTERIKLPKAQV